MVWESFLFAKHLHPFSKWFSKWFTIMDWKSSSNSVQLWEWVWAHASSQAAATIRLQERDMFWFVVLSHWFYLFGYLSHTIAEWKLLFLNPTFIFTAFYGMLESYNTPTILFIESLIRDSCRKVGVNHWTTASIVSDIVNSHGAFCAKYVNKEWTKLWKL